MTISVRGGLAYGAAAAALVYALNGGAVDAGRMVTESAAYSQARQPGQPGQLVHAPDVSGTPADIVAFAIDAPINAYKRRPVNTPGVAARARQKSGLLDHMIGVGLLAGAAGLFLRRRP